MSKSMGDAVTMTGSNHKADAAIVFLICLIPLEITELWWDTATLSGWLRLGGVTRITPWKCRLWKNTCYYLFGKAMEDFTPKTQFNHFLAIRNTDSQPLIITTFYGTQEQQASFLMISRRRNQHFFPTTTNPALQQCPMKKQKGEQYRGL
jgi:hypothetical protein